MIKGTNLYPLFRFDDISSDTDIKFFQKFCNLYDQYRFSVLHGITIWLNKTLRNHPWKYISRVPLEKLERQLKLTNNLLKDQANGS